MPAVSSRLAREQCRVHPHFRSDLYPPVNDDEEDAVLRATTYHNRDLDMAVFRVNPRSYPFMRKILGSTFPSTPTATLGALHRLPLEIVCEILRILDISSFLRVRQVNRRARTIATSLPEYYIATQYTMNIIIGLHITNSAPFSTLADLHTAMTAEHCSCGDFGGYVFLPMLARCCEHCVSIRDPALFERYAVDSKIAGAVVLHGPPGIYGTVQNEYTKAGFLTIDNGQATYGGSCEYWNYRFTMPFPHVSFAGLTPRVDPDVSCKGCHVAAEKCCESINALTMDNVGYCMSTQDRAFLPDGYLDHFRWCREAQELWEASLRGAAPLEVPRWKSVLRPVHLLERDDINW